MGCWGFLGGQKIKSPGNVMNCPENQYTFFFKTQMGVGWGGNFRGKKIKSPGNVMNCPENQKKKTRWGGVDVLGGQKIKSPGSVMNCPENQ